MKCALAVPESRIYWQRADPSPAANLQIERNVAFHELWFGSRSARRVDEFLGVLRQRFRAFPEALALLHRWRDMLPETRDLVCHWHVQLTDPVYRAFTGDFLVSRHGAVRAEVRRLNAVGWLDEHGPQRWTLPTRIQVASKLLSSAGAAGLVATQRDPRVVAYPRVPNEALSYLLHLLRGVHFAGTLIENPYLRSVGLSGSAAEGRLRDIPSLAYRRTADVIEFGWRYPSLTAWAEAELGDQLQATGR